MISSSVCMGAVWGGGGQNNEIVFVNPCGTGNVDSCGKERLASEVNGERRGKVLPRNRGRGWGALLPGLYVRDYSRLASPSPQNPTGLPWGSPSLTTASTRAVPSSCFGGRETLSAILKK